MENSASQIKLALFAKVAVWSGVLAVIFILRSFFLLVFLTFVCSYVLSSGVEKLKNTIASRTLRVVLVSLAFLGILTAFGVFVIPKVGEQAKLFVDRFPAYLEASDKALEEAVEPHPLLNEILIKAKSNGNSHSVTLNILEQVMNNSGEANKESFTAVLNTVRNFGTKLIGGISAFLLSLLFSFLIVLDLPKLTSQAKKLAHSRASFVYEEVADSIVDFCSVLGKAFEAQLFIALLNTVLTGIGLWILGIGKSAFLLIIVFFCSFIPVAGVFISSVPICLVALQTYGLYLMLLSILMIIVVHAIETYILNPRIYGHHLRANPVLVLIILTIGGKLFDVWGLVLGLPICAYIFRNVLLRIPVRDEIKDS